MFSSLISSSAFTALSYRIFIAVGSFTGASEIIVYISPPFSILTSLITSSDNIDTADGNMDSIVSSFASIDSIFAITSNVVGTRFTTASCSHVFMRSR